MSYENSYKEQSTTVSNDGVRRRSQLTCSGTRAPPQRARDAHWRRPARASRRAARARSRAVTEYCNHIYPVRVHSSYLDLLNF